MYTCGGLRAPSLLMYTRGGLRAPSSLIYTRVDLRAPSSLTYTGGGLRAPSVLTYTCGLRALSLLSLFFKRKNALKFFIEQVIFTFLKDNMLNKLKENKIQ